MSTPNIPPTLGGKVTTRVLNWQSMVIEQWGDKWSTPDTAYEMSNGRKFDSTDQQTSGIYRRT